MTNDKQRIPTVDPDRQTRRLGIKNLMPGLVERGKIKIGNKGQMRTSAQGNQFQAPQKLDHFLITSMARGQDNNFLRDDAVHTKFGDKPTQIPVRLLYDDIDLNFQTRYACYNGRTLFCSGDGEVARQMVPNSNPVQYQEVPCTCERQSPTYAGRGKCKINGTLSVMIDGVDVVGGVWKFRTTSYNSVVGILSSLALIKRITGGPIAGIPLMMCLTPKSVTDPVGGGQQTVYVVSLEYRGNVDALREIGANQLLNQHQHQLRIEHIEAEAKAMLSFTPSQYGAPDDDVEEVEEFYPEEAAAAVSGEAVRPAAPANDNRPPAGSAAASPAESLNAMARQKAEERPAIDAKAEMVADDAEQAQVPPPKQDKKPPARKAPAKAAAAAAPAAAAPAAEAGDPGAGGDDLF